MRHSSGASAAALFPDAPEILEHVLEGLFDIARAAQKIPGAQYVCLPGCGHLWPMDQPDAFNRALLDFLRRHEL